MNSGQRVAAAFEAIAQCGEDIEAAELIVRVGVAIARADRELTGEELAAIDEICAAIGISDLDTRALVGNVSSRPH